MAKKALVNLIVGDKTFEKGKIYADKEITKEVDETNFEDVSDSALAEKKEDTDVETPTPGKKGKKLPGEELK